MAGDAVILIKAWQFLLDCANEAQNDAVAKTVQGIAVSASVTLAPAVIGGVLAGPVGFGVGSLIGTGCAYFFGPEYKSLLHVLKEMSQEEKDRFATVVMEKAPSLGIQLMAAENLMEVTKPEQRKEVLKEVEKEMKIWEWKRQGLNPDEELEKEQDVNDQEMAQTFGTHRFGGGTENVTEEEKLLNFNYIEETNEPIRNLTTLHNKSKRNHRGKKRRSAEAYNERPEKSQKMG